MIATSKDILEGAEYPLTPDAESEILDALFQKYTMAQIPLKRETVFVIGSIYMTVLFLVETSLVCQTILQENATSFI